MQGRSGSWIIERKTVTNYGRAQVYPCHNLRYNVVVDESIKPLSITVVKRDVLSYCFLELLLHFFGHIPPNSNEILSRNISRERIIFRDKSRLDLRYRNFPGIPFFLNNYLCECVCVLYTQFLFTHSFIYVETKIYLSR